MDHRLTPELALLVESVAQGGCDTVLRAEALSQVKTMMQRLTEMGDYFISNAAESDWHNARFQLERLQEAIEYLPEETDAEIAQILSTTAAMALNDVARVAHARNQQYFVSLKALDRLLVATVAWLYGSANRDTLPRLVDQARGVVEELYEFYRLHVNEFPDEVVNLLSEAFAWVDTALRSLLQSPSVMDDLQLLKAGARRLSYLDQWRRTVDPAESEDIWWKLDLPTTGYRRRTTPVLAMSTSVHNQLEVF